MSKRIHIATFSLLGITSSMLAQFSPLPPEYSVVSSGPEVSAYTDMIVDGNWDTIGGWTSIDSSFQMNYDPYAVMTIGLVGLGTDANKHLGIQWGDPADYNSSNPTTVANSHTLFHRPDTMAPGHFLRIPLDGRDS